MTALVAKASKVINYLLSDELFSFLDERKSDYVPVRTATVNRNTIRR